MAKAPPPIILTKLNTPNGTRPYLALEVNWGLGSEFYGTKTINPQCKGRIIEIGTLSLQKREDSYGSSGSIEVTLDDSDGRLKLVYDEALMQNAPCILWQGYTDLSFNNRFSIFRGHIVGTPEWDEGNRTVRLTIESKIRSEEIGASPTRDDFADMAKDAEGTPWPLIFGTCKSVPTVHVHKRASTFLLSDIRFDGEVYKAVSSGGGQTIEFNDSNLVIKDLNTGDKDTIYLDDTSEFAKDKVIIINIDGVLFKGIINTGTPNKFKVSERNIAPYTNVIIGPRDATNTIEKDKNSELKYKVVYLDLGVKVSLANRICYYKIGNVEYYNTCEKQEGLVCYFTNQFINPKTGEKVLMANTKFTEVYNISKYGLVNETFKPISMSMIASKSLKRIGPLRYAADMFKGIAMWGAQAGAKVEIWDLKDEEVFLASAVPLSSIDNVLGRKQLKLQNGKDTYIMRGINNKYYTTQLESNYPFNGTKSSAVLMPLTMDAIQPGQWKDTIYVDATSTIGPNTADIIKYILQTYTTFSIDGASFANVHGKIDDTPSNFVVFDSRDALDICREIAWQARCVLIEDSETIRIKYLGEAPTSVITFNTSNIKLNSLTLTSTPVNEVITRLIGTWSDNYSNIRKLSRYHNSEIQRIREIVHALTEKSENRDSYDNLTVYKENVNLYDLHSKTVRMFIYNTEDHVKKSLKFWGHRYANPWKMVKFKTFMPALILDPFDGAVIDLPDIFGVPLLATIYGMDYNYKDKSIEITAWLPIIQGTNFVDGRAYTG